MAQKRTASSTLICLLRNDLRFHDNEVLQKGFSAHSAVVPLYCFDPRQFGTTHTFKFRKTGPHRCKFLAESLSDLRKTLRSHGSDLIVRRGKPEDVLSELVSQLKNVSGIIFQREVTKEELEVEQAIEATCKGVKIEKIWGSTLYHLDDLPYEPSKLPNMYTHFRNKLEKVCKVRPLFDMPKELSPVPKSVEPGDIPTLADLGFEAVPAHPKSAFPFCGGETSGLERLHDYLWKTDLVATYKETRNGLLGTEYSTKLSPWLAHGCLSPRKLYWEIKSYESKRKKNDSTYWVIFEVMWRDYFKFVALQYGNQFFYPSGLKDKGYEVKWKRNDEQMKAWADGKTGIPYVDANMREMLATGWMSNRGRQNVASFLTKDLQLDWRYGAEWFESWLVDFDVCSNYGNWLYTAGVGNDPRGSYRKFNMVKQSVDFDPDGEYCRTWLPELLKLDGQLVHAPWAVEASRLAAAGLRLGVSYPLPIIKQPEWDKHIKSDKAAKRKSATIGPRKSAVTAAAAAKKLKA